MSNFLVNLKNLSIVIFFLSLSWSVITLTNGFERKTDMLLTEVKQTSLLLKNSMGVLDNKLSSIESRTFNQLQSIENKSFAEIYRLNETISSVAGNITIVTENISGLTNEHEQLVKGVTITVNRVNEMLDCTYNDLCWPNLTTDVLIDTRNMVRDGSKTFRMVNSNIPKVVSDFTKVSTSLSEGVPKIVTNTDRVTANIQRLTSPKWYDRLLSGAVNGSLLYFNINRGMLKQ